jgi:hypothetical protein
MERPIFTAMSPPKIIAKKLWEAGAVSNKQVLISKTSDLFFED